MGPHILLWIFSLITVFVDGARAVRLICENGFREGTHFYHLGDQKFAYHVSDEGLSSIYFKCVFYERGCRGRAILKHRSGSFIESQPHNHEPDPDFLGERHLRENLKDDIRNAKKYVSYQEIIDQFRSDQRYTRRVRSRMTLRRLRGTMYNARMKKFPDTPYTLRQLTQALLQHPKVSATVDDEENLYAGSVTATDGSHHVAFFSPRVLKFMKKVKTIHGDGTFKSRPAVPASSQIFAIVTTWRNSVVPLGWFLMESRTQEAYAACFELLKQLSPDFKPTVIMTDWELPQQMAWQEAFPDAELQGCLWHLGRAFVKKVKKLGLLRFKDELPSLLDYVRRAVAIALLPAAFFETGLNVLKAEARQEDEVLAYLLEPFFEYVNTRWIGNPRRREWMSLFNAVHRTNNACETHNRLLRSKVGAYRPNVFVFIQVLATLEYNAGLDCDLFGEGGDAKRTRRWQSIITDRKLKNLSRDLRDEVFHDEEDTVSQFLHRASHLFHGSFNDHVVAATHNQQ